MRVLVSAFACLPNAGSEPGVGWEVVRQAACRHEVCVITQGTNREAIEEHLSRLPTGAVRFEYVNLPRRMITLKKGSGAHQLYYMLWQVRAYTRAKALHAAQPFDLVHHVTYVNSWMPTFMGWLGIPFIWSAGGRERTPRPFRREMSLRGRFGELIRDAAMTALGSLTAALVARRARVILSCSPTNAWPPSLPVRRFALGGLSDEEISHSTREAPRMEGPFRMVSAGRLLALKGFALGIRAFAKLRIRVPDAEYWIVGKGPERNRLERLASKLNCADAVRFFDWRSRAEVLDLIRNADVLVHPSVHEQFSYVILEAMATGRPVVALDCGGPSIIASSPGAILIAVRSPAQVVGDLVDALALLATNPDNRLSRGEAAHAHAVGSWSWTRVGERLEEVYQSATSRG